MLLEILVPIILIVGTIGNLLNFYVFTRPSVRGLSTFRFLAYLSIIDFFYLITGLPHIMVIVYKDYDFRDYSDFICSLHSFFTLYLSHVSSNVLAGVGVFRCVNLTTLKPVNANLKKATMQPRLSRHNLKETDKQSMRIDRGSSSRKRSNSKNEYIFVTRSSRSTISWLKSEFGSADIVVLAIMGIIFLFDCHFLIWMRLYPVEDEYASISNRTKALKEKCYPSVPFQPTYYKFYTEAYHWIDLFLYSYIPFAIMIICTVLIIYRLFKINKNIKKNHSSKPAIREILVIHSKDADETNSTIATKTNETKEFKKKSKKDDLMRKRSKKNSQIYKLLLTLNLFFFVLVTPLVFSNSLGF